MISYILAVVCAIGILAVDQYTKYIVATTFVLGGESKILVHGVIDLIYVKNDGGAWGMLGGYTWILISLTALIMLVCIALLIKYGVKNKIMFWGIILVLSGGIGNMIDRIWRGGNVVDFLHFTFWQRFPVFNVADCAVCIGAGLLILYFVIGMIKDGHEKQIDAEKMAEQIKSNGKN